jgi:hypothetical protein
MWVRLPDRLGAATVIARGSMRTVRLMAPACPETRRGTVSDIEANAARRGESAPEAHFSQRQGSLIVVKNQASAASPHRATRLQRQVADRAPRATDRETAFQTTRDRVRSIDAETHERLASWLGLRVGTGPDPATQLCSAD